jgi:RNA polymerase sigma-70 factor (ECF subfamily)
MTIARTLPASQVTFASLAERHLDDVYGYLLYMTRDAGLSEDLAADTFEKALKRFARFDSARGEAKTWLLQIARSTALDHFRSDARRRRREEAVAGPASEEPMFDFGLAPSLEQALLSLSAAERELVFLRVVLELDNATCARLLDLTPTACSTRLSRTLTRLQEKVARDEL